MDGGARSGDGDLVSLLEYSQPYTPGVPRLIFICCPHSHSKPFVDCASVHPLLRSLNWTCLMDEGATSLADALKVNTTLKSLKYAPPPNPRHHITFPE